MGTSPAGIASVLETVTLAVVTLHNGHVLIGSSVPVSAANFDPKIGRDRALDDAKRQIWPLAGFQLRDHLWRARMAEASGGANAPDAEHNPDSLAVEQPGT